MNHLILGLGGTGGNVIRAFRALLWQEHRNKEPRWWDEKTKKWSMPIANIGYLYLDSSAKELNESDDLWQCLGESIALDRSEKLLIRGSDIEATINNLKQSPGISGWIGDAEVLKGMIQNSRAAQGANQIRRFGRYLFAQNASLFEERIKEKVKHLTEGGTAEMTFHVCCTLGCGTGSGSLIDAISQIRKIYPNGSTHRIFLYVLISDQYVAENRGFFYANQFAALCELNALRQGLWAPHDVASFTVTRLSTLRDNFQSCFFISPINQEGAVCSKTEQEEMIANYIYQKSVPLAKLTPRSLHQAETFEDLTAHSAIIKDHATTFGSFGIKRFRIPEAEIREKLAYSFGSQAVLQSLYNNWSENGFMKSIANRDLPELVTDPENNQRWYLTDEHLKISKDFVLAGGKEWPSILDEWTVTLQGRKDFLLRIKTSRDDRNTWLGEVREFAKVHFDKAFRNRGVYQYYVDKREALQDYAREIRKKVETDLFERWKQGEDSVSDTEKILDTLIKHLDERKVKFDQQKEAAVKQEKKAAERIREIETKWARMGIFVELITNQPVKYLEEYTHGQIDKYVADTQLVACDFAKDLIMGVSAQLMDVRNNVSQVKSMFGRTFDQYEKEMAARIRPEESIDYRAKDVRLIEPLQIGQTIRALQINYELQAGQCLQARFEVASVLGSAMEEQTFTRFAKRIPQNQLNQIIFRTCDESAATAHSALFSSQPTELRRILGRNVIEKLHEQFPMVDGALRANLQALVQSAAAYAQFKGDEETQPKVLYTRDMPRMPVEAVVVFLPQAEHLREYREEIKACFLNARGKPVEVVDSTHNPNEILLISVCFWFELRFLRAIDMLRDSYEAFIKSGEWAAVHQVHLENHRVSIADLPLDQNIRELPRLTRLSGTVAPSLAFKYLLLGKITGFLMLEKNERFQEHLHFAKRDADSMPLTDLHDLGTQNLDVASKRLTWDKFGEIQSILDRELRESYQNPERKKALFERLDALQKEKFIECDKRGSDPVFKEFQDRIRELKALIDPTQV